MSSSDEATLTATQPDADNTPDDVAEVQHIDYDKEA